MDREISLVEALSQLRRELYAAQDGGAGEQFRFEVEQAELTLEVEFRRDGNGKVKVDVGALGAKVGGEAGGGAGSTQRQTLKLTLQVRDEALGGERAKIRRADEAPGMPADDPAGSSSRDTPPDGTSTADRQAAGLRPWEV